ncbi:hypothetical protein ACWGP3_22540, partial [Shewanella oncorhynchi]
MSTFSDAATARRCAGTPTVTVVDNRGLAVRAIQYNRATEEEMLDMLIAQQVWSVRGQLAASIDPRLFDAQQVDPSVQPNFRYLRSLSGQPLSIHSQDAGARCALFDAERGLVWQQDDRHQQQHHSYDILHRLSRIRETDAANITRVSARCSYGDADASA